MRACVEFRAELRGDTLRGHAAVFGTLAEVRGGYEAIGRKAFTKALEDSDPRALVNHDPSLILARRSAGTLRVGVDRQGLEFEIDLGQQSYARDLRESVERGDINGMSFGFIPDAYELTRAEDGRQIRTHTSVRRLVDVSPVTYPAYEGTDLQLRSLDDYTFVQAPHVRLIRAQSRLLLGEMHAHSY
jgi:hypothetical protein